MAPHVRRRTFVGMTMAGVAGIATHPELIAAAQDATPGVEEYLEPVPDKHDPPVDISTVAVAFPTITYDEGDDINNNPWTRAYEEKFGIDVEALWAVPPDQYPQRTNLMLTFGELPDYFVASAT